ncbi:MAG TPA: redox-sensing transcriptional repressor Rex [Dehalococcoidia bacterium]|nr:redox-sensing transcriptional repressor Rex [Dehalococcoidia bacterium]
MPIEIPDVVIDRLPVYARALASLERAGREVVSSQELGTQLGVTPAQIRKDLSYFGRFGKQGRGYNVRRLLEELHQILGLDRRWTMVVVGVGQLGRAVLSYGGFAPQGFEIIEAFDADPAVVGSRIDHLVVKPVDEIRSLLSGRGADIGIVATPAAAAQKVIDALVDSGVRAILNYAPIAAHVPPYVHIKDIDPVLSLQSMTFYLKDEVAPTTSK